MAVTPTSFRALFSEFASKIDYPDEALLPWITIGVNFVNADRWGTLTDFGVSLWAAHSFVLSRDAARAAAVGKTPGKAAGILNSKSLDGASMSYDTTTASEVDAGSWNLTTYGQQFFKYSRMMGAGPVQISAPPMDNISAYAWPGPLPMTF